MAVLIGVDVGKSRDPTAIAVVETEERREAERIETHFLVRHLERLPLGTPYPQVVDRVEALTFRVVKRTGEYPLLYVDSTGVGQPVVDHLRARQIGMVAAANFTRGGDRRESWDGEHLRVSLGKGFLVSRLQSLLQCARLHLPRTREAEVLTDELLTYELRVDENANDRYGAFKVGTHDDLVTALGLAVQVDRPIGPARLVWGRSARTRRAGLR